MPNGVESKVSPEVVTQAVSSLDKYILEHYGRPKRRTLRERQITVVEDLRDALKGGQTEGYVTIPTGVGKTVLFTEVTEALNEQERLETMIVVPTKILVEQTEERFHQFASDLEVGKLYTFSHDITRPVTITTYASLVRHIQDGTLDPLLYKLLVLDEVHRSLSRRRSQAVAQFTNAIKLGFTATPMYSEDKNVANLLNTEIHKMTIREAVEENLLSPFSVIIAETETDLSNVSIKSSGDYDDKKLEEAINIASRNKAAVDLYIQLFQGQTSIAYCISVKHALDLAKLFVENGIPADYISGYQDKKKQAAILRRYHEGKIKVLCNADLLIEGFDEPKASVCLNVRPTRSLVVAQQRAGRVLRLDPDNPNKHAIVVDFLDKTEDPRKLAVTFAEVAEAAFVIKKRVGINIAGPATPKTPGGNGVEMGEIFSDDVIEISGLKVIVNPQEVMMIVKEMLEKQYQPAPAGWMNQREIHLDLGISQSVVRLRIPKYKVKHPEWFKVYKHPRTGFILEYCSPELVATIRDELAEFKHAPPGWQNRSMLRKLLGRSTDLFERIVKPYRDKHPEWFRVYLPLKGKAVEFYSPGLVDLIKSTVGEQKSAPEGWRTSAGLVSLLEKAQRTIATAANKYREQHPEWFKNYLASTGNLAEFYSPELAECLRIEFTKLQPAPEGWLPVRSIRDLHMAPAKITSLAQGYKESHPEWIGTYLNSRGKAIEFYSPELIKQMQKDLGLS